MESGTLQVAYYACISIDYDRFVVKALLYIMLNVSMMTHCLVSAFIHRIFLERVSFFVHLACYTF